jgi:hypothetical protein
VTVLPKQVSHHLGENLSIGKWPIRCRQSGIVTCDKCAGDDQKKRGASHETCEEMQTRIHCRLLIVDFRLAAVLNCEFETI